MVSDNQISVIEGIGNCHRLQHFSIGHNQIEKISGLRNIPLKALNLCHNKIKKIEDLETLSLLQAINLSGNKIRSLEGLQDHEFLECIDMEDNEASWGNKVQIE